MYKILDYLLRGPCSDCSFKDEEINHCEKHQKMHDAALERANELSKKPPLDMIKSLQAEKDSTISAMKKSHEWLQSVNFVDPGRTRMAPYASHCRKCGLQMVIFKGKPSWCPKKDK